MSWIRSYFPGVGDQIIIWLRHIFGSANVKRTVFSQFVQFLWETFSTRLCLIRSLVYLKVPLKGILDMLFLKIERLSTILA